MKQWAVLATWAPLVILAIGLVCAARAAGRGGGGGTPPPSTAEDAKPTFRYNTVKFTVSGATEETYDEFRGKMLDKLTGGVSYQEIPVMRSPSTVPLSQRFILVQLENYAEQNITLAVDVTRETPPPSTAEDAKPTFRYNTVKFTVSGATEETYDEFRGKMLHKLTGGVSYQEIPVMRSPSTVPLSQRFILVQLSKYAEQNITLAVDVTNVHVVGYLSSPNHFWYFNDAPQPQISQLFPGSVRNPLGFGGSYVDLHRLARQNREQIPLSMASLDQTITTLHLTSKATTDIMKSVARSLIVCTQMVSEAIRFAYIRFAYIEDMVLENIGSQYIPDPQVISYEQNWVALSRAIQAGDGKHLKPPVKLLDTKGKPYTVTLVYDVAGPLSLMLFAKPKAD